MRLVPFKSKKCPESHVIFPKFRDPDPRFENFFAKYFPISNILCQNK